VVLEAVIAYQETYIMAVESKLELARDMLAQHAQAGMPPGETQVGDIDLVDIDESICTLIELMIRFEGDLQTVNDYCAKSGLQDFSSLVHDAQNLLETTIPQLPTLALKQHFARLGKMSIIVAELAIAQAGDVVPNAAKRDLNLTADLDEELLEFRKMAARQKLKKSGRFGPL